MKLKAILVLLISLGLIGCGSQSIKSATKEFVEQERVFNKNYTTGQKQSAYVGQPVVKVKDYKVKKYKSKFMSPNKNFVTTAAGGLIKINGVAGHKYKTKGSTKIENDKYKVVLIPAGNGASSGLLIDDSGKVHNKVVNELITIYGGKTGQYIQMIYNFETKPSDVIFTSIKKDEVDVNSGYLNYELLYGGTDGKSITLTYREFTSKDLARPAFYQNLVYEKGTNKLRYKDTVIKVYEANSEKIVYEVISDGLN